MWSPHYMAKHKLHITGPLWGESTGHQWIPLTKDQLCRKHLHIMILSCNLDKCWTYRWSWRLKALEQSGHTYFRSSLWVSLCLATALELPNILPQRGHCTPCLPPPRFLAGRPLPLGRGGSSSLFSPSPGWRPPCDGAKSGWPAIQKQKAVNTLN